MNVWISSPFTRLRTWMAVVIMWRTSKRVFAGFACCVCMGLALITGAVVTWARAETLATNRAIAATSKSENLLLLVIECNFQRFQKSQILRRHLKLRRLAVFRKNFLVNLNMQ